jgi:AhpD family alkylhydroperoxidase
MRLDARVTELIALGAATAANCTTCLEHHMAKAQDIGLSAEEITAALEVGRRVRQGAASSLDRVAVRLGVNAVATPASAPTTRVARGCCG